jgi:hypothetical protein
MARVRVIELAEIIKTLPDAGPLRIEREPADGADELFICALGFEERCLTIPSQLAEGGYSARRAVYLEYGTNRDENAVNRPALKDCLKQIAQNVEVIQIDSPESAAEIRAILGSGFDAQELKRVTFDISVASNRCIFRILRVLLSTECILRLLYCEAKVYHPTKEEYAREPSRWSRDESFGIEHGVSEVAASPEYPGRHLDPLPNSIIVFPSFKPDRARAAISLVDPALLTRPRNAVKWLLGVPHLPEDLWRLEAMRAINEIGADMPQFEVSTFDYKECLAILEQVYLMSQDSSNISLAPFGSKMQALAACLFCHVHPDVRVIFAAPKRYDASQYSRGTKAAWEMNFGAVTAMMGELQRIGQIVIED